MSDNGQSSIGSRKWRALRLRIFQRDGWACRVCGYFDETGKGLHLDHIVPRSAGGTDDPDNLQVLCAKHNLQKGDGRRRRPAPRGSAPLTRPAPSGTTYHCAGGMHAYVDEPGGSVTCARCRGRWSRRW